MVGVLADRRCNVDWVCQLLRMAKAKDRWRWKDVDSVQEGETPEQVEGVELRGDARLIGGRAFCFMGNEVVCYIRQISGSDSGRPPYNGHIRYDKDTTNKCSWGKK